MVIFFLLELRVAEILWESSFNLHWQGSLCKTLSILVSDTF